jgi:RNA polymerase sigma factor (sigma-70 family)
MRFDGWTDDELLATADPDAFAAFYRRHATWLLGFLARRTGDPELAADLVAEAFAGALKGRRRYRPRPGSTARSWLFVIAQHKLDDALRKGYADRRVQRRLEMERVVPDAADLQAIAALGEEVRAVVALEDLPPEQRDAVTQRVVLERSYDQIAADQGVSPAAVRQRVSRGLLGLRRRLDDPREDPDA